MCLKTIFSIGENGLTIYNHKKQRHKYSSLKSRVKLFSFFFLNRWKKFVDEAIWKQDKNPDIKSFTFLTLKTAQKCFLRNLQLHRCPNMVKFLHYLWAPPDKTVPFQEAVALGSKFIPEVTIQVKTRLLNNTVCFICNLIIKNNNNNDLLLKKIVDRDMVFMLELANYGYQSFLHNWTSLFQSPNLSTFFY